MKLLTRPEEWILLAIWKLKDNAYCVPILDQIEEFTGKKWTLGSIYIPLYRLESLGYLESYLGEPTAERGGKSKRFYSITADGVNALKEIKNVHMTSWDGINDMQFE
ncbi:PadR family transcriptional regulator [candidate division KSB1 bacterium]